MTTPTTSTLPLTVTITDRNETKCLLAWGFSGTPSPRDIFALEFSFPATDELFEARRADSLNAPVPVLSFIEASRFVDKAIYEHRQKIGGRHE